MSSTVACFTASLIASSLLLNIGTAHAGIFTSVEKILETKSEIIQCLTSNDVTISLLKLPVGATVGPISFPRSASKSFVVVLPDDPVTATFHRLGNLVSKYVASFPKAIKEAVKHATVDDTIAVLGKGHETTQEIAGQIIEFDDAKNLQSALKEKFGN